MRSAHGHSDWSASASRSAAVIMRAPARKRRERKLSHGSRWTRPRSSASVRIRIVCARASPTAYWRTRPARATRVASSRHADHGSPSSYCTLDQVRYFLLLAGLLSIRPCARRIRPTENSMMGPLRLSVDEPRRTRAAPRYPDPRHRRQLWMLQLQDRVGSAPTR